MGAVLTTGKRAVAAAFRVMGRSNRGDYSRRYHEALHRAVWSPRDVARIVLALLLRHLDRDDGPLAFGIRAIDQPGNPGTAA